MPVAADAHLAATHPATTYRADVDGLRAVAVVAVILCHAGIGALPGGFLGVDVFFVLSGYLIHRDLVARLARGRLSFFEFYGRRLRRTYPALCVACAATLAAATALLLPSDLVAMARGLVGALFGVSNIVFLTQVGYFDVGAAAKPLLHTWSLGVEEQFYLVAPLLALGLRPLAGRGRAVALLAGFAAAFALAIAIRSLSHAAAFYLMPARFFEFLVGAMLAERWLPAIHRPLAAEVAAAAALAALVAIMIGSDEGLAHPGAATLVPCLATAIIVHVGATRRTLVGALLSTRVPVAIGLVSYSLYLYHWPILVLGSYAGVPRTWPWLLGEAALLAALAAASYRFVEQPFRSPNSPWRRRAKLVLPAAAALLASCCVALVVARGWPGRFPPEIASIAGYADFGDRKPFGEGRCFITSHESLADYDRASCLALSAAKPNVLVIGDSHAAHLVSGLRDTWPGIDFLQATASGCKPVLGTSGASRCTVLMAEMFESFIPTHRLDAVVISALWVEADLEPLRRTLAALRAQGRVAIVFGPMPRYDLPVANLLAHARMDGDFAAVARHRDASIQDLDARMRAMVAPLATYVSTFEAMCPEGRCRLFVRPGVPMQFDYHHLTEPGADALMATIAARDPALFGAEPGERPRPSDPPAGGSPGRAPSGETGGSPDHPRSSGGAG